MRPRQGVPGYACWSVGVKLGRLVGELGGDAGVLREYQGGLWAFRLGEAAACSSAARTEATECAPARGSLGACSGRQGPVSAAMRATFGCGVDFAAGVFAVVGIFRAPWFR